MHSQFRLMQIQQNNLNAKTAQSLLCQRGEPILNANMAQLVSIDADIVKQLQCQDGTVISIEERVNPKK